MTNDLSVYEEEKVLAEKINAVMTERIFVFNKIKKLKKLRKTVTVPLCQSQIDYYINRLRSDLLLYIGRIIGFVMVMIYLVFTLFRVYWLYHPEKNPISVGKITVNELLLFLYYIIFFALVIYFAFRIICRFMTIKYK